ncbi:helix-turn-helix transcriptional regulator [Chengkuizengella sp. SCS-71B]|uniref:helix-turn-helix domain-containing protein n=1 Tax=Chengkuizengella sp. SCS-71B TaxID=3115290 RepID=UPI0032C24088
MVTGTKYSSLGELIRHHRKQAEMTLVQLEELTNVDKASISRIESGQIRRPSLDTIQKINSILNIPYEELIEQYIKVEDRADILFNVLHELVEGKNLYIITKVAMKALQYPVEDSLDLVEKLYDIIENIEEPSIRVALYQAIIVYSRAHGIMPYLAKGMLQAYLIERDDFSKLRSTYESGKGILLYEEFLTSEEQGVMYYKLSVHAYNLCLFEESIEFGKKALDAKIRDRMRVSTLITLSNSYYNLGDYKQTKEYFSQYKEFSFPEVEGRSKLTEANLHSLLGEYQLAISILQENLSQYGDDSLLHAVNQLIKLYLQMHKLLDVKELLKLEERLLSIPCVTPFKKAELALYYKLKGDYYVLLKRVREGAKCYLEAATRYAKVDLISKESECLRQIMNIHKDNKEDIDFSIFGNLENYYDDKVKKGDYL